MKENTTRMRRLPIVLLMGLMARALWPDAGSTALLRGVDRLVSFPDSDFSAEYTVVENKPGEGVNFTTAVIFRRDAEKKYLILVLSPLTDRGKGYLKIDDNLWLYDPGARLFTFTSSKERFRNSNARNSDFTGSSFAADYDVVARREQRLGKFECSLLELRANNDRVTFPIVKLWISGDSLVRKSEDYSLSGQLLRITMIPTYQGIGDRFVPSTIIIVVGSASSSR